MPTRPIKDIPDLLADIDKHLGESTEAVKAERRARRWWVLILAVLIEPYIIRRKVPQRLFARLLGRPLPRIVDTEGVAIESAQTRGSVIADRAVNAKGIGKFLARRDALELPHQEAHQPSHPLPDGDEGEEHEALELLEGIL